MLDGVSLGRVYSLVCRLPVLLHSSPRVAKQIHTRRRQPLLLRHRLKDLVQRVLFPYLEKGIPRSWVPRCALVRETISTSAFLGYLNYLSMHALAIQATCLCL